MTLEISEMKTKERKMLNKKEGIRLLEKFNILL
jgi:hypothetical protein